MATISLIFSGLALLAAVISLALNVRNEKRNEKRSEKRNAAFANYEANTDEQTKKLIERIEKLEKGITPDYEQAKAAADAVNDFNKGISNILGFDPHEALLASRRKDMGDGE